MQKARLIIKDRSKFADELVNEITKRKKIYCIDCRNRPHTLQNPFLFAEMPTDTEVIVIDNVPVKFINDTLIYADAEELVIERKMKEPEIIDMPELLVFATGDRRSLPKDKRSIQRSFFIL